MFALLLVASFNFLFFLYGGVSALADGVVTPFIYLFGRVPPKVGSGCRCNLFILTPRRDHKKDFRLHPSRGFLISFLLFIFSNVVAIGFSSPVPKHYFNTH
jgi:hypothetical protein